MKEISNKEKTSFLISTGVNKLANVVKITLGGKGKNVIINNGMQNPMVINDGVSIAKEIELQDPFENTGAILARQAAEKTNEEAGDGTTTTIVLLQSFIVAINTAKVADVRKLRANIKELVDKFCEYVDKIKRPCASSDIKKIAMNSSLDEEIAETLSQIMLKIGKDGIVSVEESQAPGITFEMVEGLEIPQGYAAPLFVTDTRTNKAELRNVPVLLAKKKISSMSDILPVLEPLAQQGKKELVVFAQEIADEVLGILVFNKVQGNFNVTVIKTRALDDLAILTGAEIVDDQTGVAFTLEALGLAKRVVASKNNTLIVGSGENKKAVSARIKELKTQLGATEYAYEKHTLQQRIARLKGGVSVIKIGGENEQETMEKKLKLEDAYNAVKSAMEEGIVEGGGLAMARYAKRLSQSTQEPAVNIMREVLMAPALQVLENAGEDGETVLESIITDDKGFDVVTGETVDFFKEGIIDPARVVKCALRNAVAMGNQILTAEAAVVYVPDENERARKGV